MPGRTIAEKILAGHTKHRVSVGDIAVCDVDYVMFHDANGPLAVKAFRDMDGKRVFDPEKIIIIFDHCTPAPNEEHSNIHAFMRTFAREQGVRFYESGKGVCHQLMVESGLIKPGSLIVGSDSHTCTYGALGSLSTGLGAADIAAVMITGKLWFRVPKTIRIQLNGDLPVMCGAKDVILNVIGTLGADGCNYLSVEFYGNYIENNTQSQNLTIANMLVEMGAKCGFTCHSGLGIEADPDAEYCMNTELDLSVMEPIVSKPHTVDNTCPVSEVEGTVIQQAVLGSCTNGRLDDLKTAADILRGRRIHETVRLLVIPASESVLKEAAGNGVLATLIDAGATICTPGCGVCVGTLGGVPADGEVVISSTNRNFKGRMGNSKSEIYLASPETVVASALAGMITDPRKIVNK